MAKRADSTVHKFEQNFLTCPVCYEVYSSPKTLPCLHTFCSHCLLSYIQSMAMYNVRGEKGFPCPVCKQKVRILDYNKPFDEWLDEIPKNFLIQNMIDCLADERVPQSKTDSDVQNALKISSPPENRQEPPPLNIPTLPLVSSRLQSPPSVKGQSRPTSRPSTASSLPSRVSVVPNIVILPPPSIPSDRPGPACPVRPFSFRLIEPARGSPPSSQGLPTKTLTLPSTLQNNRSSSATDLHIEDGSGARAAGGAGVAVAAAATTSSKITPVESDAPGISFRDITPNSPVHYRDTNAFQKVYKMTADTWNDYTPTMLSDVICLPKHNGIIALDYDNRCVKYVKNVFLGRNVTTAMEVVGRPCCVSLLDKKEENVIIVSLLDRDKLNIIRVPDLELIDVLDTKRPYRGLTVLSPNTILAGSPFRSRTPACIDLIRIDHRYKMISTTTIFQSGKWEKDWNFDLYLPHYITAVSKSQFVVSDAQRNRLVFFEIIETSHSIKALKRFTLQPPMYQQFLSLGGLSFQSGCIYFVDKVAHEVHKVVVGATVRCETILKQRDGICKPASVCVGPKGEICVADWEGKISIFKLKYC